MTNNDMINVMVTAIGGGGHGEQILKALKQADNNYWILGADANNKCPQFDIVDEHIVLPKANDSSYLSKLLEVIDKFKIKALFHGCEPELKIFSKNRDLIESRGIFLPINSDSVIELCMDKKRTNEKLKELGFDPPKYAIINNESDLSSINWFPVVIKPAVGGGGSANVFIAQNFDELKGLSKYLKLDEDENSFFIQEYVGTPEEEYTVGILHDMEGNYINSIAVKRALTSQLNIRTSVDNRTNRKDLGSKLVISSGVSQGEIDKFPKVTDQCKLIAKSIGARGAINIQCRLVDGKVKVFEINPRFSGTTSLRAMVGYNEPDILIRKHLLNESIVQDFKYENAVIIRSLVEYKL